MRTNPTLDRLGEVKLFSACTKKELSAVARQCTEVDLKEGFVLTKEGAFGHECFVIGSGEAEVLIGGRAISKVGPGDCVGEIALLDRGPRTATVVTTTPMTAWVMSHREFASVLEASPSITHKIMVTLARRLRAETDRHH
jgi:CRP-like cAMP-binding protein